MNKRIITGIIITIILVVTLATFGTLWFKMSKQTQIEKGDLRTTNNQNTENKIIRNQDKNWSENFLYVRGDELILFDPATGDKQIIVTSDKIIDYDLSKDNKFVAYSLREDGFEENSDVYLKNINTGAITKLTEKNDIASLNPKIFPDNSKVAYVRRTFNASAKKLSDGEIWVINSDGNIDSSRKLLGDDSKPFIDYSKLDKVKDESGKWTGEYFCINKNEIDDVKIGIYQISPDGKNIAYWKSDWAPECSGLWQEPYFSNINGSDFFTVKFKQQNIFEKKYTDKLEKFDWQANKIFWFNDGGFAVNNYSMPPLGEESTYYYDKDQNRKWTIYDSAKQNNNSFSQIIITDVKEISDNGFLIVYQLYFNKWDTKYYSEGKFVGEKYFVKEMSLGDNINAEQLLSGAPFTVAEGMENLSTISDVEIIDTNFVAYKKEGANKSISLYIYDLIKNKEIKVDDVN